MRQIRDQHAILVTTPGVTSVPLRNVWLSSILELNGEDDLHKLAAHEESVHVILETEDCGEKN